jgi:hypothetical protein
MADYGLASKKPLGNSLIKGSVGNVSCCFDAVHGARKKGQRAIGHSSRCQHRMRANAR